MAKTKHTSPDEITDVQGPGFEASIKSLETIIDKLEDNDTDLQDALSDFEKGINLARSAQQALADAEQKVKLLLDEGDGPVEKDFLLAEDKE